MVDSSVCSGICARELKARALCCPAPRVTSPTIDASLGVGMVGGVKATLIALLAVLLCVGVGGADEKKPGTVLWEFEAGDWVLSSPAIGPDGTVYVGSDDNKLYALKTDSKGLAKSPWPMRRQNPLHTGRVMKK